uniref:Immunoglobulin V-set domain-containing protein n=1 Tax=Pygocentrus nattereri TaxID=42514 RepID=A0A3B4ENG5_PYGNA
MSTYIRAFVLSLTTWAGSISAQSTVFMSATVGSPVVLPCDWRNIATTESASQTPHVVWRTFAGTVFERRGGDLYQGAGYEDRVDVPEDHLLMGDCSLELKNIRPEDAGVYESFLVVRRMKRSLNSKRLLVQSVELSVDDAPEESHSENKAAACSAGTIQTSSWITAIFLLFFLLFTSFHLSVDHHLDVVERLAQS